MKNLRYKIALFSKPIPVNQTRFTKEKSYPQIGRVTFFNTTFTSQGSDVVCCLLFSRAKSRFFNFQLHTFWGKSDLREGVKSVKEQPFQKMETFWRREWRLINRE